MITEKLVLISEIRTKINARKIGKNIMDLFFCGGGVIKISMFLKYYLFHVL